MAKYCSIFIQLILIFKSVFSTQCKIIEMEDLKSKNIQNIQLNNFFPSTHFGNTNVIKIRSNFKLNNLLIFLSSDKFKYCILPYLSSYNFIKICLHFQFSIPELNFQKLLPPSRFYTINSVLDIQEPTTYLQPLEINFLYQFYGEYSSLESHIVYSSKSKILINYEPHVPIPSDSICAILSQNKIIPYATYVVPISCQELLILKDDESDHFFVTFEKNSDGQFINIARGSGVSEEEFSDYVECIWEAYNLKGLKKHYWKIKSLFTIVYVKYLSYVVRIIFGLWFNIFVFLSNCYDNLVKATEYYFYPYDSCQEILVLFLHLLFLIPSICMVAVAGYTLFFCWYYATMLPFFILAFPLKYFVLGFNWYYFLCVSQGLASLYVCIFPQIKQCMPFSVGRKNVEPEDIFPGILKRFDIKPNKIMSVVPLLVQKKKKMFDRVCRHPYFVLSYISAWFTTELTLFGCC